MNKLLYSTHTKYYHFTNCNEWEKNRLCWYDLQVIRSMAFWCLF